MKRILLVLRLFFRFHVLYSLFILLFETRWNTSWNVYIFIFGHCSYFKNWFGYHSSKSISRNAIKMTFEVSPSAQFIFYVWMIRFQSKLLYRILKLTSPPWSTNIEQEMNEKSEFCHQRDTWIVVYVEPESVINSNGTNGFKMTAINGIFIQICALVLARTYWVCCTVCDKRFASTYIYSIILLNAISYKPL